MSSEREAASDEEVLFLATFHNDDSGPWGSKLDELENDLSGIVHYKVHVASRRASNRVRSSPAETASLLSHNVYRNPDLDARRSGHASLTDSQLNGSTSKQSHGLGGTRAAAYTNPTRQF